MLNLVIIKFSVLVTTHFLLLVALSQWSVLLLKHKCFSAPRSTVTGNSSCYSAVWGLESGTYDPSKTFSFYFFKH